MKRRCHREISAGRVETENAASEVRVEPSSSAELLEWMVAMKSVLPLHRKAIEQAEIVILKHPFLNLYHYLPLLEVLVVSA